MTTGERQRGVINLGYDVDAMHILAPLPYHLLQ
jgi:hypothetical protein